MRTSRLRSYELQQLPDGSIQSIFLDSEETMRFKVGKKESIDFVNDYYEEINKQFPYHINGIIEMLKMYDKCFTQLINHPFLYKARIVEQSIKCLFGAIDNIPDRDETGMFHVEHVPCPLRGRCKWDGYSPKNKHIQCVICNPVMANNLNTAEYEVAILLASPYTIEQIATLRNVKANTIRAQRLSIFRKLGLHTRQELTNMIANQRLR